jgi:hypothetical protein
MIQTIAKERKIDLKELDEMTKNEYIFVTEQNKPMKDIRGVLKKHFIMPELPINLFILSGTSGPHIVHRCCRRSKNPKNR